MTRYMKNAQAERYVPGLLAALRARAGPGESLLEIAERYLLAEAIVEGDYLVANAAKALGIPRQTAGNLMCKHWSPEKYAHHRKRANERIVEAEQRLFKAGVEAGERNLRAV